MANQPPTGRPWFRLASQLGLRESPPPPPAQPAQPPRGPPIRQLVRQPSAIIPTQPPPPPVQPQPRATPSPPPPPPPPTQPQPPPQITPPPPPQTSVTPPQAESTESAPPSVEIPKQPSTPLPPLRPIKTSPSPTAQSPKVKSPSPSPSPRYDSGDRTLKPSPEPELKTIPEAQPKTAANNGKGEAYKNARNGEPKPGTSQVDTRGPPPSPKKEAKTKDEGHMRMITIAGENLGAYMDLGHPSTLSSRKQQQQSNGSHPKQGQASDSVTNDGKSGDKNGSRAAAAAAAEAKAKPMSSLVNSNVQSVNNSIVYNSSCTQRSPGVHIALTSHRNPKSKAHPPPQ
ncbi:vegetative cell wall protein gp1 [Cocos nucifera]|uniref:Vegetative cell wall protein gp1 n=1 Tax=Cocos nucifera TaxID=13894 RepID=A0A8K0I0P9_COCNU|nr:vegetative cell wall protein gp1 [Cocos nucifera]